MNEISEDTGSDSVESEELEVSYDGDYNSPQTKLPGNYFEPDPDNEDEGNDKSDNKESNKKDYNRKNHHKSNRTKSNKQKHDKSKARVKKDQGGEKKDARMKY